MPGTPRPNVLMICVDHWPARLMGHRGHGVIETPTLDELAARGRCFTRAYSPCPVCIPARRTLMTGLSARSHGDKVYNDTLPMPPVPTLADCFSAAGYQTAAVGKLHVFPQRARIGFHEVILSEEGRGEFGVVDDYELFLGDHGHAGQAFAHGMSNNQYTARPWHLPERMHVTNWATEQMVRTIRRRDPTRPGFWYLSYVHPHPPLAPLQCYLDLYRDADHRVPVGDWAADASRLPPRLGDPKFMPAVSAGVATPALVSRALSAFYALATHIDHQLRLVLGALTAEGLLSDTVILFTSDHGDMLGAHGQWGKRLYYEPSANVPMILLHERSAGRLGRGIVDGRLVSLADVMPTLLDLAGIAVPAHVEGRSMIGGAPREELFGEIDAGPRGTRMLHDGRHKLIYYAGGNVRQLFDVDADPDECHDLSASLEYAPRLAELTARLIANLDPADAHWVSDGRLVGEPAGSPQWGIPLNSQRGLHWPPPPKRK